MGYENCGRRPQPTALKMLRGNPSKTRLNENEPVPPVGQVVKPTRLSAGAVVAWDELAPVCLAMGTLTTADVSAFAQLCELRASADLIAAEKCLPEFKPLVMKATVDGDGDVHLEARENPLLRMERQTAGSLRPYYEKFGLEPVARARISVPNKAPEAPTSKWAGVLK